MLFRRLLSIAVLVSFFLTSLGPIPSAHAEFNLNLPTPGTMVSTTEAFSPALIRGLKIHPEDPFRFDFIVDQGDSKIEGNELSQECQRMINYFLASLTIPQKDLWVNLSPVEKDRIIPDTLIKTELGRDLLSMDYMLKQLTASLVYPEEKTGKEFWSKVYAQAREKFGATDMPVNTFNKVWIVPEKASVYEQGNVAYITKIHLKVMLESDYLAQDKITKGQDLTAGSKEEVSKELLRQIIVPIIEKEVNEGKAYAQLRQMVYALTLAQWYQDVFKKNILNKDYSNKSKLSGIDLSSPENKKIIYQQYLEAYKKGVFNYIKEETDPVTQVVTPRKFFSGGFHVEDIKREPASFAQASEGAGRRLIVQADLTPIEGAFSSAPSSAAQLVEPLNEWYDLARPLGLLKEIEGAFDGDNLNEDRFGAFMDRYSPQVEAQKQYPVQSAWPVLKALTLLSKDKEEKIVKAVQNKYATERVTHLADAILLMNNKFREGVELKGWLAQEAPNVVGRRIYMTAAEVHYQEGGLGPVMEFHGKGMHDLGADVVYIEPQYQTRQDRQKIEDPLDYKDMGITDIQEVDLGEFNKVRIGDKDDITKTHEVEIKVITGKDRNGVRVYLYRDVQPDGSSFYTKMLYKYEKPFNRVTQEESMAFLNVVTAHLIIFLENNRRAQEKQSFKPAIVYNNDGQLAPTQAVLQTRIGQAPEETRKALRGIFFAFTTHTYFNRGRSNRGVKWGVDYFLMHMMKISKRFVNAFRRTVDGKERVDFTSGGINMASSENGWVGAVSNKHRDDVEPWDQNSKVVAVTNGAVPERMAVNYQRVYRELYSSGDYQRPTAKQLFAVKKQLKQEFNAKQIKTANGGVVEIDLDKPIIGFTRRLVTEKAGQQRAFEKDNILRLVQLGYNVVLMGRNQRTEESEHLAWELKNLEREIATAKSGHPNLYPGKFFFVESFTNEEKLAALGAFDIQVQDSDNHTGAAEYSEEDITANGGYQAGATWREGVILDQGIILKMVQRDGSWVVEKPGSGNTLAPQEDTAASWLQTVYEPMMRLWEQDKENHEQFYAGAAKSPGINRIMNYLITSSAYLLEWEAVLARQQAEELADAQLIQQIQADSIPKPQLAGLLRDGLNNIDKPFGFVVLGVGEKLATNKGLQGFVQRKEDIEREYGFDALLGHFKDGSYHNYFTELFRGTVLQDIFDRFEKSLYDSPASTLQKFARFERFIGTVQEVLSEADKAQASDKERPSAAQAIDREGGIDLRNVVIGREGRLMSDIFSDSALDGMLVNASGLRGNIIAIKPVIDLAEALKGIK